MRSFTYALANIYFSILTINILCAKDLLIKEGLNLLFNEISQFNKFNFSEK
jgi:hypothetical protein